MGDGLPRPVQLGDPFVGALDRRLAGHVDANEHVFAGQLTPDLNLADLRAIELLAIEGQHLAAPPAAADPVGELAEHVPAAHAAGQHEGDHAEDRQPGEDDLAVTAEMVERIESHW